jgi:hypothetical protein
MRVTWYDMGRVRPWSSGTWIEYDSRLGKMQTREVDGICKGLVHPKLNCSNPKRLLPYRPNQKGSFVRQQTFFVTAVLLGSRKVPTPVAECLQ